MYILTLDIIIHNINTCCHSKQDMVHLQCSNTELYIIKCTACLTLNANRIIYTCIIYIHAIYVLEICWFLEISTHYV